MNTRPALPRRAAHLMSPEVLEAFEFAARADAPNTQRAYTADWKHFLAWCKNRNRCPLPANPDDLALYLRFCAEKLGLKISTVQRRVSAISEAHARNGHKSPVGEWVVRNTMRRLRRELGAPARGKNPVLVDDLKAMLTHCPPTLAGLRDKAICHTTTHRRAFSVNASHSFGCSDPPTHRRDGWRRCQLIGRAGRSEVRRTGATARVRRHQAGKRFSLEMPPPTLGGSPDRTRIDLSANLTMTRCERSIRPVTTPDGAVATAPGLHDVLTQPRDLHGYTMR